MNIAFIAPIVNRISDNMPHGLVSLCTILKHNNISCGIIDFCELNEQNAISEKAFIETNIEAFGEHIISRGFTVISFYSMANSYHISIAIAEFVRNHNENILILFAGPQASECAVETLTEFPFIDMVCIGEGEQTILKLVECIEANNVSDCPNLVYRNAEGKIIENDSIPLISNLDTLPFPDYSFVPYMERFSFMPIEVGRGCPFSCKFCSTKSFWQRNYRLKSNECIIQELHNSINDYGRRELYLFNHDSLTANRSRLLSFCKALQNANLGISWRCSSRVDALDPEVIEALKKAGCKRVFMGIESGSNRIQSFINKNIKVEKILPTVKMLIENGIKPTCSFK